MIPGLTSIVIPTYQHGAFVLDAIACALVQTAMVEVIVIDDGSTDSTVTVLDRVDDSRVMIVPGAHRGVAAARNTGIEFASGEFIQFLDADDEIAPTKIERQIAVLDADQTLGWTFCDTRIVEVGGREELASDRYGYAAIGAIDEELTRRNFIPVHAPLIRRSALGDHLRFPVGEQLEDWALWRALAAASPVRYVGEVLCAYLKRRRGRNATQRERAAA